MTSGKNESELQVFQRNALLVFLFVISVAFLWVTRLMLMPILLAAIFAGLTYPLYLRFLSWTRNRPSIAAVLTLTTLAMVTLVPLAILGTIAYHQAAEFLSVLDIKNLQSSGLQLLENLKARFPLLLEHLDSQDMVAKASHSIQVAVQHFLKYATSLGLSFLHKILGVFVTLFAMFYFYIQGPHLLAQVVKLSPLKDEYDGILIANFISVTKGTLKASVFIGCINGTLAGLVFWIVGMGSPVFLGSLIFIGTFIPVIGGGPVWVPTAIYLMLYGRWASAFAVIGVCGIILHSIHSLLLPVLIGQDVKMHNLLVLMSTLGGIFAFGFIGVVIGPILGAMFLSIWKIYAQVYERELNQNNLN
jgi:predicted PurR-regulated permease PerM